MLTLRCVRCRGVIPVDPERPPASCPGCSTAVTRDDGILDLVAGAASAAERSHYDAYYAGRSARPDAKQTVASLAPSWNGRDAPPERRAARERLGGIGGRTVLLLGNGESHAELYLLADEPEVLVYSDLSPVGLRAVRDRFDLGRRRNLLFAAIDALDLPFFEESIDRIWGFAFAHHLADLDAFLAESARVLRPGGRCVFVDDAYAPLWQWLKLGVLGPLMRLSHRRAPRSPEDLVATFRGGFREEDLAERIRAVGCEPWFERQALLYYLWHRASVSLFPSELGFLARRRGLGRALIRADAALARLPAVERNLIRLIWGFDKPDPQAAGRPR